MSVFSKNLKGEKTMNLAGTMTFCGRKYNLAHVDPSFAETESLLGCLLQNQHLIYNWGTHIFFVCRTPFHVNYDDRTILDMNGEQIETSDWQECCPDTLHQLLASVFEGEWGPSATDTISRLLRSGIEVDIYNAEKLGPKDPKTFLEELKKSLN